MTSFTLPHLNHRHREVLRQLLAHPTPHNLQWHDVRAVLEALGTVEDRSEDRALVRIGDQQLTMAIPRRKDLEVDQVVELRHLFEHLGIGSDQLDEPPSTD